MDELKLSKYISYIILSIIIIPIAFLIIAIQEIFDQIIKIFRGIK